MRLDDSLCDFATLASIIEGEDELLMIVSLADCAPCITLKAEVEKARRQHPSIARVRSLTFTDATYRDPRVVAVLGRPLTIFPSLLFRTKRHDHWIRGIADKSGPFDAVRLAEWLARHHFKTETGM